MNSTDRLVWYIAVCAYNQSYHILRLVYTDDGNIQLR